MDLATPAFAVTAPAARRAKSCVLGVRRPRVSTVATPRMQAAGRGRPRPVAVRERTQVGDTVAVSIERPARDIRTVRASVLVRAPMDCVWTLLSDYGALATHIPNLAESDVQRVYVGGARVSQCGAQNILGFTFRASVVLEMRELFGDAGEWCAIDFDRVRSDDFKLFHGTWRLERVSHAVTALFYDVTLSPLGLVPVRAIEWRISEDVPANMRAVKQICERRHRAAIADARRAGRGGSGTLG